MCIRYAETKFQSQKVALGILKEMHQKKYTPLYEKDTK